MIGDSGVVEPSNRMASICNNLRLVYMDSLGYHWQNIHGSNGGRRDIQSPTIPKGHLPPDQHTGLLLPLWGRISVCFGEFDRSLTHTAVRLEVRLMGKRLSDMRTTVLITTTLRRALQSIQLTPQHYSPSTSNCHDKPDTHFPSRS